ncbi:hypothetical protein F5I97DRAFT_1828802 [Phlebopus sp. FC_14]|nr:hypothetical protein F5I97DRAFT_1828802 [Phlebopus sp. FC_14]
MRPRGVLFYQTSKVGSFCSSHVGGEFSGQDMRTKNASCSRVGALCPALTTVIFYDRIPVIETHASTENQAVCVGPSPRFESRAEAAPEDRLVRPIVLLSHDLDRANVNNAYVSGVKQELNMRGNDFNVCDQIPPGAVVTTLDLRLQQITFSPGGNQPGKLGERSGIFTSSGLAGTLLLYTISKVLSLSKTTETSRWHGREERLEMAGDDETDRSFIMDGVITLPIALYGFLVFRGIPAKTRQRSLACARLEIDHDVIQLPLSWNLAKTVLGRRRRYGMSLLYLFTWATYFAISGETESFGSNNPMGQWLSAIGGYSVEQTDSSRRLLSLRGDTVRHRVYSRLCNPNKLYSCTIASTCIHVHLLHGCGNLYTGVERPRGPKILCILTDLAGASYTGQATTFAVLKDFCFRASMRSNVVNAWWPLLFYSTTDAPWFTKGVITMICTCAATLGTTWFEWFSEQRERRYAVHMKDRLSQNTARRILQGRLIAGALLVILDRQHREKLSIQDVELRISGMSQTKTPGW